MKKANIINLIRHHVDENNEAFRDESYVIATEFEKLGDSELANYIHAILEDKTTFVIQHFPEPELQYLKQLDLSALQEEDIFLPAEIKEDLVGIVNASRQYSEMNKFLFQGSPGTGKTESAKLLARVLDRRLYQVDFNSLISSKLGATRKNVSGLFMEMNKSIPVEHSIVLLDEIEALALERDAARDRPEIVKAINALITGLDELDKNLILIASTNLPKSLDKDLVRRFEAVINFDRYTREDLVQFAELTLDKYLSKAKHLKRNQRMFRKILEQTATLPYPGDLVNLIKRAVTFNDKNNGYDYLRRIYLALTEQRASEVNPETLKQQGFTAKEIEIISNNSSDQILNFGSKD